MGVLPMVSHSLVVSGPQMAADTGAWETNVTHNAKDTAVARTLTRPPRSAYPQPFVLAYDLFILRNLRIVVFMVLTLALLLFIRVAFALF